MSFNIKEFDLFILVFSMLFLTQMSLGQDENVNREIKKQWGAGMEFSTDMTSFSLMNVIYRTKSEHKFELGIGYGGIESLEYRDADFRPRNISLHSRAMNVSYSFPLGHQSPFYIETEFIYNWVRSAPVEQWVDLDPYRYQKKFKLYHDMNRYSTNLAINWIPRISRNFEFVLGLYPSWIYVEYPDHRQTDPLYIIPVRNRFHSEIEDPEQRHFFTLGIELGFNWYFF